MVARDEKNDLAVIRRQLAISAVATFREGPVRAGDVVVALGYPLSGLLATTANLTVGNVSALAGMGDDSRYLQISAPVQPGNSGGPLLDAGGHIVGIVTAKLDAALVARFTGDIPQNVNFAVKAEVARTFLDSKGISYQSAHSDVQLPPADVGDIARPFTVEIECYAGPQTSEHVEIDRPTARVVLYEEDLNDPLGKRYIGSAIWRTEMLPSGPGLASEIGVRAYVEIPERQMKMTFSLGRNIDKLLPASHEAEIKFNLPVDFPGGGISNIPGILMKDSEQARGTPLKGLAVKVADGFFLIGLSAVDSDVQSNIDLLKTREWFDIPIIYTNGGRAILAVEKGQPGDRAFAAAFEVWKESPLPSPPPTPPPAAAKAVLPPGYLDYAPNPTPGWVPNKTQPRNVVIFCAPLSADNAPDPIVRVSVTLSIPSNGAPPSFFDVVHGSLGGKFYKRSEQYAISRSVLNNGLGWQWLGQRLNGPSKWMVGELTPTDSKHYRYREWLYDADPRVIGLSRGQLVTLAACEEAP